MSREGRGWPLYAVLIVTGCALGAVGNVLVLLSGDGDVWNVILGVVVVVLAVGMVWQVRREDRGTDR